MPASVLNWQGIAFLAPACARREADQLVLGLTEHGASVCASGGTGKSQVLAGSSHAHPQASFPRFRRLYHRYAVTDCTAEYRGQTASDLIRRARLQGAPSMICLVGLTELQAVLYHKRALRCRPE